LFDCIIWFGDNTTNSLFIAQKTINSFIGKGGKMFMANKLQPLFDANSPLLGITPASSLLNKTDTTFLFQTDSLATSNNVGWPVLKNSSLIPVIKPLQLLPGAVSYYDAALSVKDTKNNPPPPYPLWKGNSCIMAADKPVGQNPHFIYCELELQLLNSTATNLDTMWDKIMGELGY
jgi:hypothetical protein